MQLAVGVIHALAIPLSQVRRHGIAKLDIHISDTFGVTGWFGETYTTRGTTKINIDLRNHHGPDEFVDTLLHELAHAIHGDYARGVCDDGHCEMWVHAFAFLIYAARCWRSSYLETVLEIYYNLSREEAKTWLHDVATKLKVCPTG